MKMTMALALPALLLATAAPTQDLPDKLDTKTEKSPDTPIPPPVVSITKHSGNFGGTRINYRAVAGETYLKDKDGKPLAAINIRTSIRAR